MFSTRLDRRSVLAGLGSAALLPAASRAQAAPASLADLARQSGLVYGAALGSPYFVDPRYAALFEETTLLVSEWQFKIASLRANPAAYDFYNADRFMGVARTLGKPVKGHCLFWQTANPAWMNRLSTSDLQRLFDEHIDNVVTRYAGQVYAWDVVNEPFWPADRQAGAYGTGAWYQAFGPDWPIRAFKRVAAVDRTAKLVLNEGQCDNDAPGLGAAIRPALLNLVDRLQQAGAPVHAVGLESHLDMALPYDDDAFADFVARLGDTGLEVWISELDIREASLPGDQKARDLAAAQRVERFLTAALASSAVRQVVTWGLSDRYSWVNSFLSETHGAAAHEARPLPFDQNMARKPMWQAIAAAFRQRRRA